MTTKTENLDFIAKIISNFRISIPQALRSVLELNEGDIIEVEIKKVLKKQEVEVSA